jgi:hypothetical protein
LGHRDTVAALIFVGGSLQFESIEGTALNTNPDLREVRTQLAIEAVLVHAEEGRRVA